MIDIIGISKNTDGRIAVAISYNPALQVKLSNSVIAGRMFSLLSVNSATKQS